MLTVEWNDSYATGEPLVDQQHKTLFQNVARLGRLSAEKDPDQIQEILEYLNTYVANHFHYEERCMERYRCPLAAQNKTAHERFIRTVGAFTRRVEAEGLNQALVDDLVHTVNAWLISHICKVDVDIKKCRNLAKNCREAPTGPKSAAG